MKSSALARSCQGFLAKNDPLWRDRKTCFAARESKATVTTRPPADRFEELDYTPLVWMMPARYLLGSNSCSRCGSFLGSTKVN